MTQQKSERNNNTKKTVVIVALLLALIALLCFGGYTFSKYVTSGNGSGTANVAKWGYTASVDTTKLFGGEYKYDATKTASTVDGTGANLTVKADTTNRNLVAPGTTGSMTFTVGGQAEVRAQLKMAISDVNEIILTVKNGEIEVGTYNPVKWTLTKNGAEVENATGVNLAKIAEVLDEEYKDTKEVIEANTDLGAAPNKHEYTLTWAWDFSTELADGALKTAGFTGDILDTLLGKNASATVTTVKVGEVTYNVTATSNLSFKLDISVTQLAQ